jgi:predicted dienelactone hydrolase
LRRFELILAVATVFAVGWPVVFGVRPRRGIVAAMLSVALLVQLQVEGFRWQMIPLYLVAVGLAIGDVFFLDRHLEWSRRLIRGILGVVGLLLVASLPVLLPVPEIPAPSGPDPIGTMTVDLIDRSRDELYGAGRGGPREFVAQVWYPAEMIEDGAPLIWSPDWEVVAPAISRNMGLPSWFLNHTRYSLSHARPTVPIASGTFPVVIFSHGWQGVRTIALNQVEHLVSNGYIVIAPDHTHLAAATVLADGEVVYHDPAALPDPGEVAADVYTEATMSLLATQSSDLVTILDELEAGQDGAFAGIAGAADLERIGIYGHSTGGGAAVKTCLEDERCSAVLGMDPWVEPLDEADLRINMAKPALYMRSGEWLDTPNDGLLQGIAGRGESVTYMVDIPGALHNDFVMTPLLTPASSQLGLTGEIPGGRMISIVDNYVLGFFDVFLLGTGPAALDSVTFPEATVSVIDG